MFPWRAKKEPYKRWREHRCPSSRVLWTCSLHWLLHWLEILETPSVLTVNGLHFLNWKPFSDTCPQIIRTNPVVFSLSVPSGLLTSINQTAWVWIAWTPSLRDPPDSYFPEYPWECLTLHSVAGVSNILACLVSEPRHEKLKKQLHGCDVKNECRSNWKEVCTWGMC